MNALLDPPDQLPGDYDLPSADSVDACESTYAELFHENARLRMRVLALTEQLAKTPPMPPTHDDISW